MKNLFLTLVTAFAFFTFYSCNDEESFLMTEDNQVVEFKNIELLNFFNYLETNNLIASNLGNAMYHIDYDLSIIYNEIDSNIDILTITLRNLDGTPKGTIYGVEVNNPTENKFNGDKYAVIYEELENFEFLTKNADVNYYDWNYGKEYLQISIRNAEVVNENHYSIFETEENIIQNKSWQQDCEGGSNGNVSWGECMRCVRGACGTDGSCAGTWAALAHFRWTRFTIANPNISMGGACLAVAAIY